MAPGVGHQGAQAAIPAASQPFSRQAACVVLPAFLVVSDLPGRHLEVFEGQVEDF